MVSISYIGYLEASTMVPISYIWLPGSFYYGNYEDNDEE